MLERACDYSWPQENSDWSTHYCELRRGHDQPHRCDCGEERHGRPALVQVSADDLAWALRFMAVDGEHTRFVKQRLEAALSREEATSQNDPIVPDRDSR